MNLAKSTSVSNFTSLHKVQIIKDIFITSQPDALSIYLSEMTFAPGQQFHNIEITDGTYSITDDDEGHGTIFKIKANFRHPKVREDAETFLQSFRGKLVRLVLTDKNGNNRLTPAGKLSIKENVPDMPNYNGYVIQFDALAELVPYIIMDEYPPDVPTEPTLEERWLDIYNIDMYCVTFEDNGFHFAAINEKESGDPFSIKYQIDDSVFTAINTIPSTYYADAYSFKAIERYSFYNCYLFNNNIDGIVYKINIPDNFTLKEFTISLVKHEHADYIISRFHQFITSDPNFKTDLIDFYVMDPYTPSSEIQQKITELEAAGCTINIHTV